MCEWVVKLKDHRLDWGFFIVIQHRYNSQFPPISIWGFISTAAEETAIFHSYTDICLQPIPTPFRWLFKRGCSILNKGQLWSLDSVTVRWESANMHKNSSKFRAKEWEGQNEGAVCVDDNYNHLHCICSNTGHSFLQTENTAQESSSSSGTPFFLLKTATYSMVKIQRIHNDPGKRCCL